MRNGAPAGLTEDFHLDGILQLVAKESPVDVDELESDPTHFANYRGVEDDPDAVAILDEYIRKGWLKELGSMDQLRTDVGGEPVLNKFACIVNKKSACRWYHEAAVHYG